MQSDAADISQYISEAPHERQAALTRLYDLCREIFVGYEESMMYRLPCFSKDGRAEVSFASQKNYISLYCLKEDVIRDNPELVEGLNMGKGCIRFNRPEKMDFERIERLLRATYASAAEPC